jgi:hypothetical protein
LLKATQIVTSNRFKSPNSSLMFKSPCSILCSSLLVQSYVQVSLFNLMFKSPCSILCSSLLVQSYVQVSLFNLMFKSPYSSLTFKSPYPSVSLMISTSHFTKWGQALHPCIKMGNPHSEVANNVFELSE